MDVGVVARGPKVNREVLHRPLGRQEIPHLRRPYWGGRGGHFGNYVDGICLFDWRENRESSGAPNARTYVQFTPLM